MDREGEGTGTGTSGGGGMTVGMSPGVGPGGDGVATGGGGEGVGDRVNVGDGVKVGVGGRVGVGGEVGVGGWVGVQVGVGGGETGETCADGAAPTVGRRISAITTARIRIPNQRGNRFMLPPELREEIDRWKHEEQAVDAIQGSPVPRDEVAGVLYATLAFEHGFGQVT